MVSFPAEPRTPYADVHDDAGYAVRATTMAEVASGLEGVLTRLAVDPGKWVLIVDVGPTTEMVRTAGCRSGICMRAYLQWLVHPNGSFVAEVSSTASLDRAHALTAEQEDQLAELGWSSPEPPSAPNFFRVSRDRSEAVEAAALAVRTLQRVFGVEPREPLMVKMTESRGLD
jgi:hypothetical protein